MNNARTKLRQRPVNYFEVYDYQTRTFRGSLVDLTTEGLRLLSERPMLPGEIHRLQLHLPQAVNGRLEITFEAECRWCNECTSHLLAGTFGIGLQLRNLRPDTRNQIERFIASPHFLDWRQLPDYEALREEAGLTA